MPRETVISLKDWILIALGTFLMGLSLGLTLGGFNFAYWIFVLGFLLEIPSLLALKRHKK